jgi:hypothetical protein
LYKIPRNQILEYLLTKIHNKSNHQILHTSENHAQ